MKPYCPYSSVSQKGDCFSLSLSPSNYIQFRHHPPHITLGTDGLPSMTMQWVAVTSRLLPNTHPLPVIKSNLWNLFSFPQLSAFANFPTTPHTHVWQKIVILHVCVVLLVPWLFPSILVRDEGNAKERCQERYQSWTRSRFCSSVRPLPVPLPMLYVSLFPTLHTGILD